MTPGQEPQTFAQKVLARTGEVTTAAVGTIVDASPDVVLTHDNTAAIREIWQQFSMPRVSIPERMAITLDHAVPAPTPRHAKNHAEIRDFVRQQGIENFFEVGRGICHQVLSEEALVLPGQLILGADSHTPHFGWLGAFGAGVGRSEMAALWATGKLWLRVPESMRVEITGGLGRWVSAKDLALSLIGDLGADGGLYRSVEIGGAGVRTLTLASRMVLANMMAEFGAKTSFLAPDDRVYDYLAPRLASRRARRRDEALPPRVSPETVAECRREVVAGTLLPDPGALYVEEHTLDASAVRPQVACPHTVDNTVNVDEIEDVAVDQAFIGTCTNGRLEDLEAAHGILKGRRIARGTRLLIIPASQEVLQRALELGYVADLMAAGAVFATPGCGPCMGNHLGVLAPGEVCISSANRNFRGRMGTPEASIYLASPAVVAASAVAGRIVSPETVVE